MLQKSEFDLLYYIFRNPGSHAQRVLAEQTDLSAGNVNSLLRRFRQEGLIEETAPGNSQTAPALAVTEAGLQALEPYRVTNAVIMAAGMSSRFAPLSYEKPKALLNVKGEILIEREIRQLKEAGIDRITLVVGYMKEKMFYLADRFGLDIVVNEDYYRFNNTSTLILVADRLDNTYICSSDNYFTENPFEPYVYRSYYSAVYTPGETDEYCLTVNKKDRITDVTVGGCAAWYMLGHVYWDRDFSRKFVRILKDEYRNPLTKEQLWENLYMRHIDELDLYIHRYDSSVIKEFDSLDELREFDTDYLRHTNSNIFVNICRILNCEEQDITGIHPIKTGLTNLSFQFNCKGEGYVYRHPGVGTEAYINRASEAESMAIAKDLKLDETFIHIDPKEGWKISHFVPDAKLLDYHNEAECIQALSMLRTLHQSGRTTSQKFDLYREIGKFLEILSRSNRTEFEDMPEMRYSIDRVHALSVADHVPECLCHCDSYNPNFLIDRQGKMYLIDWEYSGMSDPSVDIGTFIACSDYTEEEAERTIDLYLGHKASPEELRHYIAGTAIAAFYWFVWALYQDSVGKSVGEYLYIWYRYTKRYSKRALELYGA